MPSKLGYRRRGKASQESVNLFRFAPVPDLFREISQFLPRKPADLSARVGSRLEIQPISVPLMDYQSLPLRPPTLLQPESIFCQEMLHDH